jgi:hypothetical protein
MLDALVFFANAGIKDSHPAFFVRSGVSVEVDHLAIIETDAKPFFNEHVTFFLLRKARLTALAALASSLLLGQCSTIVDEFTGIGQIDRGAWLPSRLVVGCELGSLEFEEAATPVLY